MKLKGGGELYKDDEEKIQKLGQTIQEKWYRRPATKANLEEFATEVKGRFLEIGYVVNVDITPALVGVGPPDIAVQQKINIGETDHDKIRHEVLKERGLK